LQDSTKRAAKLALMHAGVHPQNFALRRRRYTHPGDRPSPFSVVPESPRREQCRPPPLPVRPKPGRLPR
jgi:hypothetical protein